MSPPRLARRFPAPPASRSPLCTAGLKPTDLRPFLADRRAAGWGIVGGRRELSAFGVLTIPPSRRRAAKRRHPRAQAPAHLAAAGLARMQWAWAKRRPARVRVIGARPCDPAPLAARAGVAEAISLTARCCDRPRDPCLGKSRNRASCDCPRGRAGVEDYFGCPFRWRRGAVFVGRGRALTAIWWALGARARKGWGCPTA